VTDELWPRQAPRMDQSADALPAQCSSLAPYARVTRRIRSTRFPGEWTSRGIRGVRLHMATAEPGRCTGGGCGSSRNPIPCPPWWPPP